MCSLLVCLGLHINFPSLTLTSLRHFVFGGLCWDTVHMSVYLPPNKLADIQQLALSMLKTQPVTIHQIVAFFAKASFCANGHSQLQQLCYVIHSDMLSVYCFPAHLFSSVPFSFFSFASARAVISFTTESGSLTISASQCGYYYRCHAQSLDLLFSGFWIIIIR